MCSIMKLGLLVFQNRLRFQLLLAKITDNDFLGERLRQRSRSKPCAISRPFSHEIRFSMDERERKAAGKASIVRARYRLYHEQCRMSLLLRYSVEGCSGCCGSPRVATEFRDRTVRRGEWNGVATRPLSASSVRALTPCNYLLSVIFFNHRSPRRSAFTLTDSRRKDSVARTTPAKHVAIFTGWCRG